MILGADPHSGVIKCCLLNARSLCNKLDAFSHFLESQKFDLALVTETWLNDSITDSMICGPQFNVARADRGTRGGGVAICLKKCIKFTRFSADCKFNKLEACCIDIFTPCKHRVICIYRPPNCDLQYTLLLMELISELCRVSYPVTIGGDFNLPDIVWPSLDYPNSPEYCAVMDGLLESGLTQLVVDPTRNLNVLDLILTTSPVNTSNVIVNECFDLSDHCVVEFCISADIEQGRSTRCPDYKSADFAGMARVLAGYNWDEFFEGILDINIMWGKFSELLRHLCRRFIPYKKVNENGPRTVYPYYLNAMLSRKRRLWRNRFEANGMYQYKKYSTKCSKAIKRFKLSKERNILDSGDLNKLFAYVNRKRARKGGIGAILDSRGSVVNEDVEKCEIFASYFGSVFVQDDNLLPYFRSRAHGHSLDYVFFTPEIVCRYLKQLKPKFSHSPDGIPQGILKNLCEFLCEPLQRIFKFSFDTGSVPDQWRSADVVPVHKKDDCSLPKNYRPVSLTCPCSKVMESIISDAMSGFLLNRGLLSNDQHGFLKKRSTCTQLLGCLNDWCKIIDDGGVVETVYIDFAKAFDTVCHNKLIHKMKGYGITGNLLSWHNAFLDCRTQRVKINKSFSKPFPVLSGVPQGSVLGPLYFLIYINDILEVVPRGVSCKLFADDVKLYSFLPKPDDDNSAFLQEGIGTVALWAEKWQLILSQPKCFCVRFGRGNCNIYHLGQNLLPVVKSCNDLGVTLASGLKVKTHCLLTAQKAYKVVNVIFRCFLTSRMDTLLQAFCTYVRPILEYCSPVWSPCYVSDIDIIESVQRYFTRRLFSRLQLPPRSYPERLLYLKLEPLELRRSRADLHMCYSIVHADVNITFADFFEWGLNQGRTRGHTLKLRVATPRTNTLLHSFANRVVTLWNLLPPYVNGKPLVRASHLSLFKSRLRNVDLNAHLKFSRNM